jgi:glycosyltransferase involved in cell wall biosynthesis
MLSAIIATHESEETLVPTLAALVPGVMAGLLKEVIVTDVGSKDATSQVADIAGCKFISSDKPLGLRLSLAAEDTRTPWLLFLRPGTVLESGWTDAASYFMESVDHHRESPRAAVFRRMATTRSRPSKLSEILSLFRNMVGQAQPEQGLLIARWFYNQTGGHRDEADPERALLWRIKGRRITTLQAGAL